MFYNPYSVGFLEFTQTETDPLLVINVVESFPSLSAGIPFHPLGVVR